MEVKEFSFLWLQIISQSEMWSTKICCFPLFSVGQAACCPLCGFLLLCVCVGLSWVGSCLKFCLRCRGPPNGKVFLALPSSSLPPCPLPTHTHIQTRTHTPGVGMICRFRCFATLLPILASFRHRQHFLPPSSTHGRCG